MLSQNSFTGGWKLGIDPGRQPKDSYELLQNFRLLSSEGNAFVLTNLEGTSEISSLPAGYIPLAIAEKSGVAYFILAELVNGVATGRGELGSFPSPDTDDNGMDMKYRPLMNYGGDNGQDKSMDGEFRSLLFNFSLENEMDLELQDSYDGSINMIFTDGRNPVRIVNTGFSTDGHTYKLIDRQGSKDSNRYNKDNFENTIQLILRSNKIMGLEFKGVEEGGKVKEGTNFYYFKYATQDGNETDIIGESMAVPVFHGNRPLNIRGGEGGTEDTNKQVRFQLTNLDDSYKWIRIYFAHVTGIHEPLRKAYRIERQYMINGSSMEFTHNGYENLEEIDPEELNVTYTNIGTVGTLAQEQGQLLMGDITERTYEYDSFKKFGQKVGIYANQVPLDIAGSANTSRLNEPIEQVSKVKNTEGWNLGYANPMNVYNRVGYFDRESYPYAMRFIMPGGILSPAFPVIAFDDENGKAKANYNALMQKVNSLTEANNGWLWDTATTTGINNKGIYRFPNRYKNEANIYTVSGDRTWIQGICFKFPNADDPAFQEIKKKSIGCQLMRAARKADLLLQGLIIDTHPVPAVDTAPANEEGYKLWNYNAAGGGYNDTNSRFLPAFDFITESHKQHTENSSGQTRSNEGTPGLMPVKMNLLNRTLHKGKRFALLSHDIIGHKTKTMQLINGRDVKLQPILSPDFQFDIKTGSIYHTDTYFSLIRQQSARHGVFPTHNARMSWVEGGQHLKNSEGFSGGALYQGKFQGHYGVCSHLYNDYIGVSTETVLGTLGTLAPDTAESGIEYNSNLYNAASSAGKIVNIYPGQGPRTFTQLSSLYSSLDGEVYFPISERMSWSELEGKLNASRELVLYGGDCFTNVAFRRLFINQRESNTEESSWANVGYTIAFVQQSPYNIAFRGLEEFDLNEAGKRTFAPYMTAGNAVGDKYAVGNKWRENRQLESARMNQGYKERMGEVRTLPIPLDSPFLESRWPGKVIISPSHSRNAFENSYRYLAGINEQDYGTTYGKIIALRNVNGRIVAIMERGVGVIGVNERVQTGSDTAGAIFLESSEALSPQMGLVSTLNGAQRKSGILVTVSGMYGVDERNLILWQFSDKFSQIGRDNAFPYMKKFGQGYQGGKKKMPLHHNLALHWNKEHGEVWFTFYSKVGAAFLSDSFSLVYNERMQDFTGDLQFLPYKSFSLDDQLVTFDVRADQHKMHMSDHTAARNTFHGVFYPSRIRFTMNEQMQYEKYLDVLYVHSNAVLPDRVRFEAENTEVEMVPVYDPNKIHLSNAHYEKGKACIPVPKVTANTGKTAGMMASAGMKILTHMMPKSRMKGNYAVIEISYDQKNKIRLYGASLHYQIHEML